MTSKRQDFSGTLARVRGDRWRFRDDTFTFDPDAGGGSLLSADCVVSMELREYRDGNTLAKITNAIGDGVTVNSATSADFVFESAVTALLDAASVWYEIKVQFADSDECYTAWHGEIGVLPWAP